MKTLKLFSKKSKGANKSAVSLKPAKETRSAKGSLFKLSLPFMVSGLVLPIIVTITIFALAMYPVVTERKDTISALHANYYAKLLELKLNNLKDLSIALANQVTLENVIPESNDLRAQEITLLASAPNALSINLFRGEELDLNTDIFPPINFAAVDLARRAVRQEQVYAEVHRIDNKWILRYAHPIGGDSDDSKINSSEDNNSEANISKSDDAKNKESRNKGADGVLLLNFNFDKFMANIPTLEANTGLLRLTQQFSTGKSIDIWQQGENRWRKSETAQSTFLNNNNLWTIHFSAAEKVELGAFNQNLFWGIAGGGSILALILAVLGHILLKNRLNINSETFFDFIDRLMSQGVSSDPKYTLDLFEHMSTTLGERISNARTRLVSQAASQEENNLTENEDEASDESDIMLDPLFQNQDALDIDMSEEDENLLNVNTTSESSSMETSSVNVPDSIFRAYDVRGVVGETLTPELVFQIGQAIGSEALSQGESTIAVARDGRLSGPQLIESLIQGLASTGCNVLNIGMEPTPVLYYAANTLDTRSGVMLTGSHNPSNYNGLKIVINGHTLSGDDIQNIKHRVISKDFAEGAGQVELVDVKESYLQRIVSDVVLARPMKIVIDCGNGVPGAVAPALFTALGCEVTPLFCEVDGNFPNHHPDPSKPENLQDLINCVINTGADIGLAFDGDGDRIGVVTPKGEIIFSDRLLMLFARDLLSRNPGADIIFDVKCTRDLADLITSQGGRPIMWKTGHSFIKAKLKETGAVIAGEMSGHIFFNDRWYGFDDALYSAARLLEILSMETISADEVFNEFPSKVTTPEINITVTDESKFKIVEELQKFGDFAGGNVNTIDGVRVDFPDSWGLVRASNTTPVLVARFEADTESALEEVKALFRNNLLNVDSGLELPF